MSIINKLKQSSNYKVTTVSHQICLFLIHYHKCIRIKFNSFASINLRKEHIIMLIQIRIHYFMMTHFSVFLTYIFNWDKPRTIFKDKEMTTS